MKDLNGICSYAKQNLRGAVDDLQKAVGDLPILGKGYEYSTSFTGFLKLIEIQRTKVSSHLTTIFSNAGTKPKFPKLIDDVSKIIEANHHLDEKICSSIDQARSEIRGNRVQVPQMNRTAESHAGMPKLVSESTPFGKDSGGRYAGLSTNPIKKQDESKIFYHKGLYVAKNLVRPQTRFQNVINNEDAPFKPKLKIKHHAKSRPDGNLRVIDDEAMNGAQKWESDKLEAGHPYDYELESFTIPKEQKVAGPLSEKKKLEEIPLTIVDNKEELIKLVEKLNKLKLFAVDVEHHNYRTFLGLTCLVQISTYDHDYIIDPFPIWTEMWRLNEPFTNPKILKIFHGADFDIEWLQRDFGIYVVNMFDTFFAMKALGMSRLSLQYLVEYFCGITLGKELQKADWRIRPLTAEHLNYARGDTHYLLYCYEHLRNDLLSKPAEQNLLKKVYNQSTLLCRKTFEQPRFSEMGYLKLISKRHPTNQQNFALKELWKWRDATAREVDESPDYVLPDHMLMQIAEVLPREANGIISCCSPVPVYLKRDLLIIHKIMNQARDIPLDRSFVHGRQNNALAAAFTRSLDDVGDKTPFEKRLDEYFSCDCNEAILPIKLLEDNSPNGDDENMEVESKNPDKVFTIYDNSNEIPKDELQKRLEKVRRKIEEYATPFEAYQLAITKEKPKVEPVNDPNKKVTFSHKDECAPSQRLKPPPADEVTELEGEIPLLTLTKKGQKRRQQQINKNADVFINRNSGAKRGKFNKK
uniref:HRDC domain-containing protein n=1 Tax=Panagrolaimus superbus TaxID=310955 RepID=A0A914Z9P3_9BILA